MSDAAKPMSDDEVGLSCARAVREAFELSLRYLAVCTDPEGNVKRYGPFESFNEARFSARQVFDHEIEVVEMHDWGVHCKRMEQWHRQMDEHRKMTAAFKDAIR